MTTGELLLSAWRSGPLSLVGRRRGARGYWAHFRRRLRRAPCFRRRRRAVLRWRSRRPSAYSRAGTSSARTCSSTSSCCWPFRRSSSSVFAPERSATPRVRAAERLRVDRRWPLGGRRRRDVDLARADALQRRRVSPAVRRSRPLRSLAHGARLLAADPRAARRRIALRPFSAILYLFAACVACTVLGILITFSPFEVCSRLHAPGRSLGVLRCCATGGDSPPGRSGGRRPHDVGSRLPRVRRGDPRGPRPSLPRERARIDCAEGQAMRRSIDRSRHEAKAGASVPNGRGTPRGRSAPDRWPAAMAFGITLFVLGNRDVVRGRSARAASSWSFPSSAGSERCVMNERG